MNKILVLGIGNILCQDEGIGVWVVRRLKEREVPSDVTILEGGVEGLALIDIVSRQDYLIVVDALKGGEKPGTIYRFDFEHLKDYPGFKTAHDVGILDCLRLSELVGKRPKTTIIGIEPKEISLGLELTPLLEGKIPEIIELVLDEIRCMRQG